MVHGIPNDFVRGPPVSRPALCTSTVHPQATIQHLKDTFASSKLVIDRITAERDEERSINRRHLDGVKTTKLQVRVGQMRGNEPPALLSRALRSTWFCSVEARLGWAMARSRVVCGPCGEERAPSEPQRRPRLTLNDARWRPRRRRRSSWRAWSRRTDASAPSRSC